MRLLQIYVIEYCFDNLYVIAARFNAYTKLQLSFSTIKRALRRMDIQCYVSIQKPYFSKSNIAKRIIWASTHQHWTVQQWSNVVFTDDSSFTDRPTKNRLRVRRHRGQRLAARYIVPTFKSGFQTVSVWAVFSMHGRTPLVCTVGGFNQHSYRAIIDSHILAFVYNVHGGPASFLL